MWQKILTELLMDSFPYFFPMFFSLPETLLVGNAVKAKKVGLERGLFFFFFDGLILKKFQTQEDDDDKTVMKKVFFVFPTFRNNEQNISFRKLLGMSTDHFSCSF